MDLSSNSFTGDLSVLGDGARYVRCVWCLPIVPRWLSGTLPTEIGLLKNVEDLNLAGNKLTGMLCIW